MFIANDENNNKISIEQIKQNSSYYCPCCGEPLIIKAKNSLAIRPHFAHKKGSDCDDFSHDMSEWHLKWQQWFPKEFREVVVENNGEKHRADVLINNTVIEFQHSPITAKEIARRNNFYLSCGYEVIWVFDAEGQIKNRHRDNIDPSRCTNSDLCWKRAKQQFSIPIDKRVSVFIQYKTSIGDTGKENDIMLLLSNPFPKDIFFINTRIYDKYYYITPFNFLKEFNINVGDNIYSIRQILNAVKEYNNKTRTVVYRTYYYPRRRRIRF